MKKAAWILALLAVAACSSPMTPSQACEDEASEQCPYQPGPNGYQPGPNG